MSERIRSKQENPVCVEIEMRQGLSLRFVSGKQDTSIYPNDRIQKGLMLVYEGVNLVEEGTGFGVPIVKLGYETVFPGSARLSLRKETGVSVLEAKYDLNLVPRMAFLRKWTIKSPVFYKIKEWFSGLHRKRPSWRKVLTWCSGTIRTAAGLETRLEPISSLGEVAVVYTIAPQRDTILIAADFSGLRRRGCTELVITNEQGANYFDHYRDSNGASLVGEAIGTWNETHGDEASFVAPPKPVFTLHKIPGARMFRGRESVKGRLAWAGLNYVLSPDTGDFVYEIRVG